MKWRALTVLLRICAWLPLPVLRGLGWLVGAGLWWSGSGTRRVAQRNIGLCLPDLDAAAQRRLARARMTELASTALEMGPVWFRSREHLESLVVGVSGREVIDAALAEGRGVMILAPHQGNWEVLGLYLGIHYGIHSMYLPHRDAGIDALIHAVRSRCGAHLVPADGRGVRALLKVLKGGGMAGILPDQEPKQAGGVFAPFFGRPALTMTLAGNLVARTGALPVCAWAERVPGGFRLHFFTAEPGLDAADELAAATALNRSVERCALARPAQYQWEYKRFKRQPDGRKLY